MRLGYGWPKRYNRVNEQGRSYVSRAGIGASSIISKFQKQSPCRRLRALDPAGSCRKEAEKLPDPAGKQRK